MKDNLVYRITYSKSKEIGCKIYLFIELYIARIKRQDVEGNKEEKKTIVLKFNDLILLI